MIRDLDAIRNRIAEEYYDKHIKYGPEIKDREGNVIGIKPRFICPTLDDDIKKCKYWSRHKASGVREEAEEILNKLYEIRKGFENTAKNKAKSFYW